jgi:hypothetical protein
VQNFPSTEHVHDFLTVLSKSNNFAINFVGRTKIVESLKMREKHASLEVISAFSLKQKHVFQ